MNHYVYRINYGNPFYIGVRSCKCAPADDVYWGSGNRCLFQPGTNRKKTIISTHATREEAEDEEARLLLLHEQNPWSRNRKLSRSRKRYV